MTCACQASAPAALPPVLQKAVHVEVVTSGLITPPAVCGSAGFAAFHAPLTIPAGGFNRRFEPLLDQPKQAAIDNAGNRLHQLIVGDGIEGLAQIGIDNIGVSLPEQNQHRLDRIGRAAPRPGNRTPPGSKSASRIGSSTSFAAVRLIANRHTSFALKAHQKSGPSPPASPGFDGTTTLSDSRIDRRLPAPLRSLPSSNTGLPRLRVPLSRRAVPITRRTGSGAPVGCFPNHAASPDIWPGRRPQLPFREPAQDSIALRPVDLLDRPRRPSSQVSALPVTQQIRPPATGPSALHLSNRPGRPAGVGQPPTPAATKADRAGGERWI